MPSPSASRSRSDAGWLRHVSPLWPTLILSALVLGCEDTPTDVNPDREHNPVAPSANALVSGHHVGGDPAGESSIYRIFEKGDGTWFAHAIDNGVVSASRLTADGTPLWSNRVESYTILGMKDISTPWLPVGAISVGSFDSDDDGETDNSRVTAWGPDGALLDEIVLTGGDLRRQVADVAVSTSGQDQLDIVVVGAAWGATGSFYPYAARVFLRSDNTLGRGEEFTYPALDRCYLTSVESDTANSVFYAGGNAYTTESTILNAFVLRLSDSLEVDWHTDLIATPGLATGLSRRRALCWTGSSVIAVGGADVGKENPPSGGGYWLAALAASVSSQGVVQWMKTVALTTHDDRFQACWVDGAFVYAVGGAASFYRTDSQRSFGYGLLTKLDLTTGEVLANYTFGDPGYESGFNTAVVHGDRAWCAGFTEAEFSSQFRSWFAEIDFTRPVELVTWELDSPPDDRLDAARPAETARPPRRANDPGVAP